MTVLQLLATALRLWVRQQCQSLESLEIKLEGSARELVRGGLQGVRVEARRVVYKGLELERVELRCDALQVQIGPLWRGRPLRLDHPFRIQGLVEFTPEGLSRAVGREEWQPLAEDLGRQLLGGSTLKAFRTEADQLVLVAKAPGRPADGPSIERPTRLAASAGSIAFHPVDGHPPVRLTMDPAIRIARAELEGGRVLLEGEALVTP
jgi:hypothetical protein